LKLALLPKGGGDFRGIGLLEIVWKLLESIINVRLTTSITFHDALHGFRAKRGTGTAILEVKLMQELAKKDQSAFPGIFLDLKKAYDHLLRLDDGHPTGLRGRTTHVCPPPNLLG
jgi:hypothetical protein